MSDSWEKIAIVALFAISPFILYGVYRLFQPPSRYPSDNGKADIGENEHEKPSESSKLTAKQKREKAHISRSGTLAGNAVRQEPVFGSTAVAPELNSPVANEHAVPIKLEQPDETEHTLAISLSQSEQQVESELPEVEFTAKIEEAENTDAEKTPEKEISHLEIYKELSLAEPEASVDSEGERENYPAKQASENEAGKNRLFPELDHSKLQYNFFYTVKMRFEESVSTPKILTLKQTLTKAAPSMFQTTFCYEQQNNVWETPRPGRSYHFLAWSIPLSNRTTHLDKNNIASIVSVIQKTMRTFNGQAEFPPHSDIERRLHLVEEFCNSVDHTVSVSLQATAKNGGLPQSSGDIVDLAESWGLEMIDNQLRRITNGETWFTLVGGNVRDFGRNSPDRKVASLVVSLDIPHVSSPIEAFDGMFEFCGRLARVLSYEIVDSEGEVIEQDNIAHLRAHMLEVRSYMMDYDVTPGSKTARALFN